MKAVILVPFRAGAPERDRNWKLAQAEWRKLDLPIFPADSVSERFDRAGALNIAASLAGDWDVAIVTDADIILGSIDQADAALMRAYRTGAYTVTYSTLWYLSALGMTQLENGTPLRHCVASEHVGFVWESCFAIHRALWDRVGGFDSRFRGYGHQGVAFFYAAGTFGGRERISGDAYHLAHHPVDRTLEPHMQSNRDLVNRYGDAVDDRDAMTALLKEAR